MLYYMYNDVDEIIGFKYNEEEYSYIKNIGNDIIGIKDSSNNIIVRYEYDAYGNIIKITDNEGNNITEDNHIGNINPYRYRSYYYDTETNLYYLNSRYYSPTLGRFINVDNYISTDTGILGYNMYCYCNNNFINYSDPTGHAITIGLMAVIAGVGALVLGNSRYQFKKAGKQIKNVQNNKNVPDKTKELNNKLKKSSSELQKKVQNQNMIEKLNTFRKEVDDNSKYDLKSGNEWNETISYNGIIMDPQDIGNFHYGYIGRSIGLSEYVLISGAGVNQLSKYNIKTIQNCFSPSICDDPRDTYFISMGIIKYDNEN